MDGVVKEFKTNIVQGAVKFGMGGNTGRVSGLLFADESNLQRNGSAFVRVCETLAISM